MKNKKTKKPKHNVNKKFVLAAAGVLLAVIVVSSIIVFQPPTKIEIDPTLSASIDYSNTYATISTLYERKTFFADGLYWLFYCNGTNLYYTSSSDGLSWNTQNPICPIASSSAVSLWYNGKIHYAIADGNPGHPVTYEQGTINGDTIQWSNNQTVVAANPTLEYYNAYVTVDSNGIPWVSCMRYDETVANANTGNVTTPYTILVSKAETANGDNWGVPYQLVDNSSTDPRACLISMPNQNMYAIVASQNGFQGKLWNGAQWLPAENIANIAPVHNFGYSAVSLNGQIELTFTEETSNNIMFCKRSSSGNWETSVLSHQQGSGASPLLSVGSDSGTTYVFWINGNTLQLRRNENGSWRTITVQNLNLTSPQAISCFYQTGNQKIGVAILELINRNDMIYDLRYSVFTTS